MLDGNEANTSATAEDDAAATDAALSAALAGRAPETDTVDQRDTAAPTVAATFGSPDPGGAPASGASTPGGRTLPPLSELLPDSEEPLDGNDLPPVPDELLPLRDDQALAASPASSAADALDDIFVELAPAGAQGAVEGAGVTPAARRRRGPAATGGTGRGRRGRGAASPDDGNADAAPEPSSSTSGATPPGVNLVDMPAADDAATIAADDPAPSPAAAPTEVIGAAPEASGPSAETPDSPA
jgi:hypothetical protein